MMFRATPVALVLMFTLAVRAAVFENITTNVQANINLDERAAYMNVHPYGYYKLFHNTQTFRDAEKTCRDEGSHLMIINSQAEVDAVHDFFNFFYSFEVWVGAHRFYGDHNNMVTVLGQTLNGTGYSKWYSQPSTAFATYPAISYYAVNNTRNGLYASTITKTLKFICESPEYKSN